MSKRRNPQDKARTVMEFFSTNITAVELCRKHNVSPVIFQDKGHVPAWGQAGPPERGDAAKSRAREVENLKRIIGEITVANDILKKPWREQGNEDAGSP